MKNKILLLIITLCLSCQTYTKNELTKNIVEIQISKEIQVRQGLNQCGPASAMAIINAYNNEIIPLSKIDKEMNGRTENKLTYPWGITGYLKDNGIKSKGKILMFKTKNQRLNFLKNKLSEDKPIIILNKLGNVLHYFTILGYNEKNDFYIYDSMQPVEIINNKRMTVDSNGNKPGNLTLSWEDLLIKWKDAKFKFINYYVIVPKYGINDI